MFRFYAILLVLSVPCIGYGQSDIIISQYIETNSGTSPKGIEIANISASDIDFSVSQLEVYQGTNGANCALLTSINSGLLKQGEVWVIGTSNLTSYANTNGTGLSGTTNYGFSFNGNDALRIYLDGIIQDEFGVCGTNPGTSWNVNGVNTANHNLQIKTAICDGDIDGWTDPSERYDELTNGSDMTGFGNAPNCSASSSMVNWANLQSPATGNTNRCNEYLVYARVYVDGVTNNSGESGDIEAWIGYSTTNTDPSTWASSNWVSAGFFAEYVNNDEYRGDLGPELDTGGTYYYASRFRYDGGPYAYGGYNTGGGGFWDGSSNISGQVTISNEQPNFANVDYPASGNIDLCNSLNVYAQVYEPGITDSPGQGDNISAWIGYNSISSIYDVTSDTGWTWVEATYDSDQGNNDQYVASIGSDLPPGTYYYASRFQINCNDYSYGGIVSDNYGNFWGLPVPPGNVDVPYSGVLSVNDPGTANVVISEIMYSTSGVDDEWIEICNISGSSQDLSFYEIEVGGSSEFQFPCGTLIADNACITISLGDGGESEYNPGCPFTTDYSNGSGTGTLPNSTTTIELVSFDNSIIDTVTYNSTDGGNNTDGSLHVIDLFQDNSSTSSNWFEVLYGGSGGNTSLVSTCAPMTAELDVERNTFASITENAPASTGNNTIFSQTAIGTTSSAKIYYIRNEGTAALNISSISSSNATEFSVVTNPAPVNNLGFIPPNEVVFFEIAFSPSGLGTRNATISIISNDPDTSPFRLNLQGEGECANVLSIYPEEGPRNTVVTAIGSNFGGSTSASLDGINATVAVISSTEIKITIPSGASTSNLIVNNDLDCDLSAPFNVIDNLISSCEGSSGIVPTSLFISEVTDKGVGSHTYIEIYNGTGSTVDLDDYEIRIHNNGQTNATSIIPLNSSLLNNDIYVIGIGGTDATDPEGSYIADQFSGVGGINEDDNIRLYYDDGNTETWIDLWGDTSGDAFTISSKDYTYRRKNTGISAPSISWDPDDWTALTPVNYTDIGTFDFSVGTPPSVSTEPSDLENICSKSATITVGGEEGTTGGKDLTYQWFVHAPGDSNWTEISDTSLYNNFTTTTLDILNTYNLDGYQYYCQIKEDDATCYKASRAVILTLKQSVWNGSVWLPSDPDLSTIAVLSNDLTVTNSNSFSACQLFVESPFTLNIGNNAYVEIQNDLYANGNVTVETAGALVQKSEIAEVSGNGTMLVNKTTSVLETLFDYTYWSSPVNEPEIGTTALVNANPGRIFWFNAQNYEDRLAEIGNTGGFNVGEQDDIDDDGNDWTLATASNNMTNGLGYAATHSSSLYSGSGQYPYSFTGRFNTGPISVNIYRNDATSDDTNWNLVGNPFPSAISIMDFFDVNTFDAADNPTGAITGALYIWSQSTLPSSVNSGNQQINFSNDDYFIVNSTGVISPNTEGDQLTNPYIPSGQAFFISMSDDPGVQVVDVDGTIKRAEVSFNNAMRRTGYNDEFFRTNNDSNEFNKIWFNINVEDGMLCQTLIGYLPDASVDYDGARFDAKRHLSSSKPALLYSTIEGNSQKFGIQGRAESDLTTEEIIILGFESKFDTPIVFNISIDHYTGDFMEAESIYIIDHYLNSIHNLKDSNYYFTSEEGVFLDRFSIGFSEALLSLSGGESPKTQLLIYPKDGNYWAFKINGPSPITRIQLFDLLGRLVYDLYPNKFIATYYLPNLSNGSFIAKVELSNMAILTKKIIRY